MESPGKEEKVEVLPCESLGEEEVYRLHQSVHMTTTTLDIITIWQFFSLKVPFF